MTYTSLDAVCRRYLLEKRLTLHWYVQSASLAASCLRQLHIDTLKIVNTVELTVDGTGGTYTATLPNDFQDYITIGSKTGQFVRNLPQREGISRLQNFDSDHVAIPFGEFSDTGTLFSYFPGVNWQWNISSLGESTGGIYGYNSGNTTEMFKVIKERNQIQMLETFGGSTIVLQYISDGQSIDNATQVDSLSQDCLYAFIAWKSSVNADNKDSPEATEFFRNKRELRARLSGVTLEDIRRTLFSAYRGSIKS